MGIDVGQVLSRSFEMFRTRLGSLVGLWAVFFVIQIVAVVIFSAATGFGAMAAGASAGGFDNPGAFGAGMILWFILFYVMYLLIYCAQSTSMSAMASPLLEPNFGDAFGRGVRFALTLLGVLVLLIIAYFVIGLVVGLVIGLLGAISSVLSTVVSLALIPVIFYLACRLAVISPVIAVEQQGNPITAIARTWNMTRGNVLGIFLTLLVFIVAIAIFVGLIFLLGAGGIMTGFGQGAVPGVGTIVLVGVLFLLFGALMSILGSALISSLHEALAGTTEQDLAQTFG